MKKILIGILFSTSLTVNSQNTELVGAYLLNHFYDLEESSPHYNSTYTTEPGYAISIGIEDVKIDWLTMRFTFSLNKYSGKVEASDGGLAFGSTTSLKIDKSILSIGVFPLNFRLIERIDINLGFQLSGLIHEDFSGTNSGWRMDSPDYSYNLEDRYNSYSSKHGFGFQGRLAYDFKLSDIWLLSPQYAYYIGIRNEFHEFPKFTKSMKHYFGLGLQRRISKN